MPDRRVDIPPVPERPDRTLDSRQGSVAEEASIERWECEKCGRPSYLHEGFGQHWRCWEHGPVRMLLVRYVRVGVISGTDPDE